LIIKAVQIELAEFLSQYQDMTDFEGRPVVVRNDYLPHKHLASQSNKKINQKNQIKNPIQLC
jgi:hypothetical protein